MRFSSTFYQSILDNMNNAFSYHRIITDKSGQVYDFEYIQVNPAFEKLLGRPNSSIIGHTVRQIEPDFLDNHPDLLEIFGEVALWGSSRDFEYYCKSRQQWFSISAYSPQPGYFITILNDVTATKKAEETIKRQEENLLAFFNGIDSLLFVIDYNGEIKEANHTALETLGYAADELKGQNIFSLQALESRAEGARFLQAITSGKKFNRTLTLVNKNRDAWISVDVRVVPGRWNEEKALFAACRDITELRLSEAKFFRAFHINPAIMSITTFDKGYYIDINKSFCNSLEYDRKEVLGHNSQELGIYYDISQRDKFIEIVKTEGRVRDFEIVLLTKSGKQIIGLLSSDIIRIGADNYLLTNVTDITERRLMEQELEQKNLELEKLNQVLHLQASTDDLTGIYNHRFIFQRLREEIERAERYQQPLSIMMLDLDHFKAINDKFGHQTGDIILHTVAQTIKQTLRNTDIPGRYGGEEFMVILPQTVLDDAVQVAERIREQIEELSFDDERLKITISIGVAAHGKETGNELLAQADKMLYQAKDNGRNRVEY